MKFSGILILFLMIVFAWNVDAQVQVNLVPFSAASPYLEPDGRKEILKISDKHFVVLSKIKGGFNSESDYSLEKYDVDLNNIFKTPLHLGFYEDVKEIFCNGTHIVVLTVVHQNDIAAEKKLLAYGFDVSTGVKAWEKVLMEGKVAPFQTNRSKGAVEETIEIAIASSLNKNYIIPFEYQYDLQFSPDGSKFIVYSFDYSKTNMIANAMVFDKNLNKVNEGIIPIDNNQINYAVHINNRGEVYVLNVDRLGRVILVQYNMQTKENILLDIQYSSTQRESLKLCFINDDVAFVGSVNTSDGRMVGVMYAKFDFQNKLVEKINFHKNGDALIQTVNTTRTSHNATGQENWLNYELVHFYVNQYEKVLMILEKREVMGDLGYKYKSETIINPDNWKERIAKVNVEGLLMYSFNSSDELMWENYYYKSQVSDVTLGMTSSSCLLEVNDEMIRMVYASSDKNATGVFNTYHYTQWDAQTGSKIKDMDMQNDLKLSLLRNYSIWMNDKIILTGRKGLLGKKYMISSYKISPYD